MPTTKCPPIQYERADPEALAKFDPNTKRCTMNCGQARGDPRSWEEVKLLCPECETRAIAPPAQHRSEVWHEVHLLPMRVRLQRLPDGRVVMQLPGYYLAEETVIGKDKGEAIALMDERMHQVMRA